MTPKPEPNAPIWTVACLCAAWCNTCTQYQAAFRQVADQVGATCNDMSFHWIDLEDQADVLGESALDVENFPTVMVLEGTAVRFFGTVLPHAATLQRMLVAAREGALAPAGLGTTASALATGVLRLA
ncbi:MAG: hypothetical protein AB9M60_10230, partial [Leptothrix sp. (in: b-proteobacteria)]